ncbi:TonB-dependent receptor plug domain-containing protein [Psychrobacter sp. I-STPA10]|uniref:TonB-dependent receptor plug domain-containing protein n=1 Tax=Psychrobacter sp. I-STPA10 TaxID=2585769 RepID=UPI001E2E1BD5|nr:TonB-dependent receptor [Psychrobacter sp. I-STPA10]
MRYQVNILMPVTRYLVLLTTTTYCWQAYAQVAVPTIIDANNRVTDTTKTQTFSDTTGNAFIPSTTVEPIVVTATRSQKLLGDAPVTVHLLDQQTLTQNRVHTLKEALELLPNVYLHPVHGKTGYEISMQGFSSDQVLVLIDGLPITASTGSTVNLNQYLNVDVEQIEVIQGAASAQYGSAAMGGVINVITKSIDKPRATFSTEVGSNGKQNPSGKVFDSNTRFVETSIAGAVSPDKRLKARISGSYLNDAGLSLDTDKWSRLKDASKQQQINAKVSFTPNINDVDSRYPSHQYWLEANHYEEDDVSRFLYYAPPRYLPQQKDEHIRKQRLSIGGHSKFAAPFISSTDNTYQLSGSAMYENYDSDSNTTSNGFHASDRNTTITTSLAQLQLDLPIVEYSSDEHIQTHAAQLGIQWQQDELSQHKNQRSELTSDQVSREVIEAYAQDDWFIGDNWELVAGVRYQKDTDFGDHIAPKVAIKYDHYDNNARKHIFRASVGSGYRVPNLKERYFVFDHSNLGYKVMGNPKLVPETSTSYQVGYQTDLNSNTTIAINGFYNDIKDLIQTDNNHPRQQGGINIYQYKNVDSAKTYGGDIQIDWRINPKANLNMSYAYTQTHNNVTDTPLTYQPNHKVTAALNYQLTEQLQLIQRANYESKQLVSSRQQHYSPAWWTWDSKLNYAATPNLDLYAGINNLFDVQRKLSDANDQRPIDNRQWLLGASLHW